MLGRRVGDVIIVDNSPASYLFQPENALPCESFIDDPQDRELYLLADLLETIQPVADVRDALLQWTSGTYNGLDNLPLLQRYEGLMLEEEDDELMAAPVAGASAGGEAAAAASDAAVATLSSAAAAAGEPSAFARSAALMTVDVYDAVVEPIADGSAGAGKPPVPPP